MAHGRGTCHASLNLSLIHTTHVKVKEEKILELSSDPFIMVCHGDG